MKIISHKQSVVGRRMKFFASGFSLLLLALTGCTKEDMSGNDAHSHSMELQFGAAIEAQDNPSTRARTGYNVVPYLYSKNNFYITVYQEEETAATKKMWSIYEIPSGTEGTISSTSQSEDDIEKYDHFYNKFKDEFKKTLNWYSRDKTHYFYGWSAMRSLFEYTKAYAEEHTTQLVENGTLTEEQINGMEFPIELMDDGNVKITFVDNRLEEANPNSSYLWKTSTFGDSGAGTDALVYHWKNGEVLERLIGTRNGPLTYNSNGIYVPLQFRHLVSKIMLSEFSLIDNSTGTSSSNLKGYITFYGLPKEAILYTNPQKDGHPVAPYVEMVGGKGWDYDQTQGVKYAITTPSSRSYSWEYTSSPWHYTYTTYKDAWYICPEVDFGQITFKIELYEYSGGQWIPSTTHGKHGAYYGDFKNVTFSRSTNGSNYDDPLEDGKNPDLKILHAGEYMTLTIRMSEKGNPVVKSKISDWPTAENRTGSTHIYPGIYDLSELKNMSDIMKSKNKQDEGQFYDFYGDGTTDKDEPEDDYWDYDPEKNVIELYDDIGSASSGTSSDTKMSGGIYVDDDYILDGNGHTINCTSYSTISIGNVRDVYLRYYYSSTEYIVYIDKQGYVWKVDPSTYERTKVTDDTHKEGYNVNEMNKNPMTINLSTGKLS